MIEKYIDTHFHLDYYKNHTQLYNKINRLEQYTLCVTNSPGIFVSCRKLYPETKYVKFALGFHPRDNTLSDKDFSDFLVLVPKVDYIGEVGMDFSSDKYMSRFEQVNYFKKIVDVCSSHNKLMSVHLRKSEDEAIDIISKYRPQKCIIHWYTGNAKQLVKLIELDCYFSINANMVRNEVSKKKLLNIPKERILVESDGPFTSINRKKYFPEYLKAEYEFLEERLNIPNLSNVAYINFKELLTKSE